MSPKIPKPAPDDWYREYEEAAIARIVARTPEMTDDMRARLRYLLTQPPTKAPQTENER